MQPIIEVQNFEEMDHLELLFARRALEKPLVFTFAKKISIKHFILHNNNNPESFACTMP